MVTLGVLAYWQSA